MDFRTTVLSATSIGESWLQHRGVAAPPLDKPRLRIAPSEKKSRQRLVAVRLCHGVAFSSRLLHRARGYVYVYLFLCMRIWLRVCL